ncbi:lysophospholipid acyltransferase family protein [Roseomonas sp. OT10]|uniref:lysophospholipid acyltransferase family protein n=1 Tax=Roseomonas cutis TaxID=2897332 RepID=UPI001E402E63|nr:lysophospholipid acyltransferase family protein [Roseomonas sp. OT10]UFN51211.1 lysophospholipid acyltransferase family protein [Roseomonas sp. OT10]
MLKRLLRHPATLALGARLIGLYLGFCYATTRWTVLGAERIAPTVERGGPLVVSFWHERLPLMPVLWRKARVIFPVLCPKRVHVLVSRHRDGRFIGAVMRQFELEMVHGSTSRGGAAAAMAMLRSLQDGQIAAITPDGPRGPAREAAPGVAQLAAVSGVPVVPCAAATTRMRLLPSWDRMRLPLPFGRGAVVVRPVIQVPREGAELLLPLIASEMDAACVEADDWAGRPAAERVPAARTRAERP